MVTELNKFGVIKNLCNLNIQHFFIFNYKGVGGRGVGGVGSKESQWLKSGKQLLKHLNVSNVVLGTFSYNN